MDLCSLPDEMLASVLKYSNFETVYKIRKLNKRVDSVVKRNKLNKLDIEYLALDQIPGLRISFGITDVDKSFKRTLETDADERSALKVVRKYLRKFRTVHRLFLRNMNVNSSLLQLLLRYKSLFRGEVNVLDCTVHAQAEELAELLAGSRECEVTGNSWPILGGIKHGANDEIACALIPVTPDLSFYSNTFSPAPFPGITDKTLKCLAKHPKKFFSLYYCNIGATARRAVKLAKRAFANGHDFEYQLGRIKVNDREEGEYYASLLKEIDGVDVEVGSFYDYVHCNLKKSNCELDVDFKFDPPVYEQYFEEQPIWDSDMEE